MFADLPAIEDHDRLMLRRRSPVSRIEFPALHGLPKVERDRLLAAARPRRYAAREVVFHEGDPGDSLHLIVSGRVAVRVTTPLGDTATLALLGAGQTFGELALLEPDARRTATVLALEPTHTLALRGSDLFGLRAHPQIDRFLNDTLAGYVRRLSTMVLEALYLPVDVRIARRLAELTTRGATAGAAIRLTQDDIASLAGTTRSTANRVLRSLAAQGALALSRGRIEIVDRRRLDHAAR